MTFSDECFYSLKLQNHSLLGNFPQEPNRPSSDTKSGSDVTRVSFCKLLVYFPKIVFFFIIIIIITIIIVLFFCICQDFLKYFENSKLLYRWYVLFYELVILCLQHYAHPRDHLWFQFE